MSTASPSPPKESGKRLAALRRGESEELRISWDEYQGNPYVSLRVWARDRLGRWWPDARRGCSIRVRELQQVARAIEVARDLADAHREGGWLPLGAAVARDAPFDEF